MHEMEKHEVEIRELFEQQRNIFEPGAQRANKRAGSFGFLTWPFFLAPLIAGEEFLAAAFNSAAAEEQAKAALAGAAQHAANDDLPAHDPSKSGTENETAEEPAASSEAHAVQLDPSEFLAQPQKDAAKPSTARSEEAVAAATGGGGGGGGGGGDDADSRDHDAHTSIDNSSVNEQSANSRVGSNQQPDGTVLEPVQSDVFGASFNPSIIGSAPPPEAVSSPNHDVAGTIAPVVAAVEPVLTPVTDTAGTLVNDVVDVAAPVVAAVEPVLTPVTDTAGTLVNDVVERGSAGRGGGGAGARARDRHRGRAGR